MRDSLNLEAEALGQLEQPAVGQRDVGSVDFASAIRPLLSDRCFPCHGPDAATLEADLRLDLLERATEDRGGYAAIVPGNVIHKDIARPNAPRQERSKNQSRE